MAEFHDGYELLILSIFERAVLDIVAAPWASPDPEMNYREGSPMNYSADAKRFIDKDNRLFKILCSLISMEPNYAEKALLKRVDYILSNSHMFKGKIHALR